MFLNELFEKAEHVEITGLATDNRRVKTGDLFVCIKGYTVDGHKFASMAEKAGAAAIVCEQLIEGITIPQVVVKSTQAELPRLAHEIYHRPSESLDLFAITGTNGKTTTAYILEHLLQPFEGEIGYIGTNGIRYAEVVEEAKNTTPDAHALQQLFARMKSHDVKQVAIEVSSHALELHRVDYCEFKSAIFTNLTPEHLDFHPTMEDYFEAKFKLFTMLKPDGYAIVNLDDEYGPQLVSRIGHPRVYTYGVEGSADFNATNVVMNTAGTAFTLHYPEGVIEVQSPLLGQFNVYNVLGAMAAVYAAGLPMQQIVKTLATLSCVDGRMELINEGQDFTVIVDYAHTPDGVEKVLQFVTDIKQNEVDVVIGCPGDRDRTKRPVIAKLSVDYADKVIFTTDDPHSEQPEDILDEMTSSLEASEYDVVLDRKTAIAKAINRAKKGDIVLIAGRGHQRWQYWSSGNIELDDREIAKELLKKRLNVN